MCSRRESAFPPHDPVACSPGLRLYYRTATLGVNWHVGANRPGRRAPVARPGATGCIRRATVIAPSGSTSPGCGASSCSRCRSGAPQPRATRALAVALKRPTAAGSGSARIMARDLPSADRLQLASTGSAANIGPLVRPIRQGLHEAPSIGSDPEQKLAWYSRASQRMTHYVPRRAAHCVTGWAR
jgi:hypothetical protein